MAKLKKQVQQKKSTATAGGQKKAMEEDIKKGKQKMRKYLEKAS